MKTVSLYNILDWKTIQQEHSLGHCLALVQHPNCDRTSKNPKRLWYKIKTIVLLGKWVTFAICGQSLSQVGAPDKLLSMMNDSRLLMQMHANRANARWVEGETWEAPHVYEPQTLFAGMADCFSYRQMAKSLLEDGKVVLSLLVNPKTYEISLYLSLSLNIRNSGFGLNHPHSRDLELLKLYLWSRIIL